MDGTRQGRKFTEKKKRRKRKAEEIQLANLASLERQKGQQISWLSQK